MQFMYKAIGCLILNKQQQYFVTAEVVTTTTGTKKIFISTNNIKEAFEVEQQLLNQKTLKIMNMRHGRYPPRLRTTHKHYIQIQKIDDLLTMD